KRSVATDERRWGSWQLPVGKEQTASPSLPTTNYQLPIHLWPIPPVGGAHPTQLLHPCSSVFICGHPTRPPRTDPGRVEDGDGLKSAYAAVWPQHFLYFLPLPQGQGSLRPIFGSSRTMVLVTAAA